MGCRAAILALASKGGPMSFAPRIHDRSLLGRMVNAARRMRLLGTMGGRWQRMMVGRPGAMHGVLGAAIKSTVVSTESKNPLGHSLQRACMASTIILCTLSQVVAAEIPITSIAIDATPRGDQFAAIDGNPGTFSYLTAAFSLGPRTAFLGFGAEASVSTLQFLKATEDIDGRSENNPDYSELTLLFTTDTDPNLANRHYVPVTNLSSPLGSDQIVGTIDAATATIHAEHGPAGAYTVQFDTVNATGLAFGFVASDPQPDGNKGVPQYTHYPVAEFYASVPEPAGLATAILGFIAVAIVRAQSNRRRR